MAKARRSPNKDHKPDTVTRREVITRAAGFAGVTGVAGYLAFAPEDAPLSMRDWTGLRSMPEEERFVLPDFRVEDPLGPVRVGVGRGGTPNQMLRKALGDNARRSHDSADFGLVSMKQIAALVEKIDDD